MGEVRLPQRVMFEELVGGKGYSARQEKDWIDHLKEDMSVFRMKFEGWRKAAQKAGRRFRRVEEGAEFFMQNWHETERRKAAERRAKAASASSTVVIKAPETYVITDEVSHSPNETAKPLHGRAASPVGKAIFG